MGFLWYIMAVPQMKVLIKEEETAGYIYKDMPIPEPCEGELLVKVLMSSICGSDIALYKWNQVAKAIATLPFIPGHECVGEVVKVGPGCGNDFQVGLRVCCENHFFCGRMWTHCLLAVGIAKAMGAGKIFNIRGAFCLSNRIATDINQDRLGKAKQMGADVLVNGLMENLKEIETTIIPAPFTWEFPQGFYSKLLRNVPLVFRETLGDGVGRVIECSGAAVMVNNSFSFLRKGGRIVLVGIPKEPLHVENVLSDILFKSITMKTVHGRKIFSTWEKSEQLIHQNKVDVTPLITHELPMSKYEQAFQLLFKGEGCKILMNPQL
ncbi:hypothetical protein QZH41_008847 [Actinostola sp. cb2023]|nr:hypothetical protein QZH41_008847 [Actinostola sp. cb2023]